MKERRNKTLMPLICTGIICTAAVLLFLLFLKQMPDKKGGSGNEIIMRCVSTQLAAGQGESLKTALAQIETEVSSQQEQYRLLAEYAKKSPEISKSDVVFPVAGEKYADISIERLNMSVPLYYGDTNALLKKGAGQYTGEGSAIFGEGKQILVAGHNTKEFKPLQNAQLGDIVKVTTSYGEFAYQIVRIQVYNMNDSTSYDFNLDHEQLAMYTCYPFSGPPGKTERYFCYCDKIYGPVFKD